MRGFPHTALASKTSCNHWATQNEHPFLINGHGSFLGYEVTDRPGRVYRSARDIVAHSNEEAMQIFALEMANRGVFRCSVVRLRCLSRGPKPTSTSSSA